MRVRAVIGVALLTLGIVCNDARAQSEDALAKRFIGTWRLVSNTERLADGTTRPRANSVGNIIYTEDDHMCAVLMDPSRPRWNGPNPYGSTTDPNEALSAIAGFDGYCSRVEVNVKGGFVLHHVDVSIRPNLVGVTRKRFFKFEGPNRVALSIDPAELTAPAVDQTLTWERVTK